MIVHWRSFIQILTKLIIFVYGVCLLGLQIFYSLKSNIGITLTGIILIIISITSKYWVQKLTRAYLLVKNKISRVLLRKHDDDILNSNQKKENINDDRPIKNEETDFLGYQGYAEIAVELCSDFSPEGSRVMSIESPWGNGKTSLINLICKLLEIKGESIKIIRFDAWFFSDSNDLISLLIEQLIKSLYGNERDQFKKLLKIVKMANKGNPDNISKWILAAMIDMFVSNETIYTQKTKIIEELKKLNHKILIIIDDIDRLQPKQILELFKMVKSVIDLPNVNFCLAYDKNSISENLNGHIGNIDKYLEKIVQDPFHLLENDKLLLMNIFTNNLADTIKREINSDFLKQRWLDIYWKLLPLLDTPRVAKKLVHVVNSGCIRLKNEINWVDFICIEAIRLNDEKLFILTNKYKDDLTNVTALDSNEGLRELNKIISEASKYNAESVSLLRVLFPALNGGASG